MSIRIYQAFYRDDQKPHLDAEFFPYDNRSNPVDNLYERYIYQQTEKLSLADGIDCWGTFSWQWRKKLSGPSAQDIINFISSNPDSDVYIFNGYLQEENLAYNVWEQGQWCHPHILYLGRKILEAMGEDPNVVELPMTRETFLVANYFAGNADFWRRLLSFLDRMVVAMTNLNPADSDLLMSSAGYTPNPKLNHTGFICERMISTFLILEKNLKICAWPGGGFLSDLKLMAVRQQSKQIMQSWDQMRQINSEKIATSWIEKQFS